MPLDTVQPAQRSNGETMLHWGPSDRLVRLRQRGCAKLFLPRTNRGLPEAVFVNTAGGLTGGDKIDCDVRLMAGARLVCTTQSAERIYRSAGGSARVRNRLVLGARARLDWLPQETILFDQSSLHRETEVEMAEDAQLLLAEMLVLGRTAMGEININARLVDTRRIRRGGRLLVHDSLRLELPLDDRAGGGLLGGAIALATLFLVAPDAEDQLPIARSALPDGEVESAASSWDGKLVVRFLSHSAPAARRSLARCLTALRRAPLPRAWAADEVPE